MNAAELKKIMRRISDVMKDNRDYLGELDARNGDGDLGVSMSNGFAGVAEYLAGAEETDLGRLLFKASSVFNENSPSSLGTILSLGMMGMAKALKGCEDASLSQVADALQAGLDGIMAKAHSKPGEKTVLDSLCPAVEALRAHSGEDCKTALAAAAEAAAQGSESTRQMRSVHGRAAYYGDKSIGVLDGGSVVGRLIFEGASRCCAESGE
jgi:dihydroxyacetone kinase-like protein